MSRPSTQEQAPVDCRRCAHARTVTERRLWCAKAGSTVPEHAESIPCTGFAPASTASTSISRRESLLLTPYAERARMLKMQEHRCAICRERISLDGEHARVARVDRDEKGVPRGMLCRPCQAMLETRADPQIYYAAAKYLERHMPVGGKKP